MTPDPVDEARRLLANATPGDWYLGSRMACAGVMPKIFGEGHCAYCARFGEPVWTGRTDINGTQMAAHVHIRTGNKLPSDGHHVYSWPNYPKPDEATVCGNYDYEDGGVVTPADANLIAAAPRLLAALCDEVEHLRAYAAELEEQQS